MARFFAVLLVAGMARSYGFSVVFVATGMARFFTVLWVAGMARSYGFSVGGFWREWRLV
jgi:hypothetical protein